MVKKVKRNLMCIAVQGARLVQKLRLSQCARPIQKQRRLCGARNPNVLFSYSSVGLSTQTHYSSLFFFLVDFSYCLPLSLSFTPLVVTAHPTIVDPATATMILSMTCLSPLPLLSSIATAAAPLPIASVFPV